MAKAVSPRSTTVMVSATPIAGGATLLAVTALYPKASGKICVKHMNSKNFSSESPLIAVRPLGTFKRISKSLEIAPGLMFMFFAALYWDVTDRR